MLFGRRVTFTILVLVSQLLLIAMAVAWCIHMVLIARHGEIYFIEENPVVLYGEIAGTILITLFAVTVFAFQCKRLGERRRHDDKEKDSQG